jgi:L-ascorbate metabolism protein UlaG (beta-lactamase superfamily)
MTERVGEKVKAVYTHGRRLSMARALTGLVFLMAAGGLFSETAFPEDTFPAAPLGLKLTFLGHATFMIAWGKTVIHVDPVGQYAEYSKLPKADIVLVTHEHFDHLDPDAIKAIRKPDTEVVLTKNCLAKVPGASVMKNGESRTVLGIGIEAVPAYNLSKTFHPKGVGNGYVLTLGSRRMYVAGDTENTPEMKGLKNIDIAFLPMNLPYTMTPEMVADAALAFRPKVLYPYHFGETDTSKLATLLKDAADIEVRIRPMK